MSEAAVPIRWATSADAPALLQLMRELAAFEGYLDRFAVTEAELLRRGFGDSAKPEFAALVAEAANGLAGYAVVYRVPFTFDLRPTLVLKELFVAASHRRRGIARRLLDRVREYAEAGGCGRICWTVLPGNERAAALYREWGGAPDEGWEHWQRELPRRADGGGEAAI